MFQGILHEEPSVLQFALVTVVLGGWAAWMTGRACAKTWRHMPSLIVYLLGLGVAVRFIHHALFNGTMLTPQYYLVDTTILVVLGVLGYRYTRAGQMTRQYHWLFERSGPLSWKAKA